MGFEEYYKKIPDDIRKFLWIKNGARKNYHKKIVTSSHGDITLTVGGLDEPSLIDTNLPIESGDPPHFRGSLDIFNSYEDLTPRQRGRYLSWLIEMHPNIEFQYPFIYFQGLERHLIKTESIHKAKNIFEMMGFIVNSLNYREISGYLFNDALYAYNKFNDTKFLEEYINYENLNTRSKSLYNSIVDNAVSEYDIKSYIWDDTLGINTSTQKKLKELYSLRNYYVPIALKYLYGVPYILLPPDVTSVFAFGIKYPDLKNPDQYLMGNISYDLENTRTFWIQSVKYDPQIREMAKEVLILVSQFIDSEFKRRVDSGLKIRNAVLKHMYNPLE
ncbi:TerB N-terminal domain-containing protein [Levilactobacillus brevis]|uniref:TerB N-terminal domain-containing protein n=1 Tax=Levilactobacillus brevis TaxID=1580 RepID=UPI0035A2C7CD